MDSREAEILTLLKQSLRSRGVTYAQIARHLGLSELAVKRSLNSQGLTLDRLIQISEFAQISLDEVLPSQSTPSATYVLTLE